MAGHEVRLAQGGAKMLSERDIERRADGNWRIWEQGNREFQCSSLKYDDQ